MFPYLLTQSRSRGEVRSSHRGVATASGGGKLLRAPPRLQKTRRGRPAPNWCPNTVKHIYQMEIPGRSSALLEERTKQNIHATSSTSSSSLRWEKEAGSAAPSVRDVRVKSWPCRTRCCCAPQLLHPRFPPRTHKIMLFVRCRVLYSAWGMDKNLRLQLSHLKGIVRIFLVWTGFYEQ